MNHRIRIFALLLTCVGTWASLFSYPSIQDIASTLPQVDSISSDSTSMRTDSIAVPQKKEKATALDAVVNYEAADSIVFIGSNNAILHRQGKITYRDINLNADYIQMDMDNSEVFAQGVRDSTNELQGKPVFKQGDTSYESETMRYNFGSQKAYITNVITQQGEGYVTGFRTKKMPNDEMFMENCRYTTCDHHDHPHFYFNLTKAKVRQGKDIVTGPLYFVLEDVPLPLALPFGFFPFNETYSSGIIMPTFGDELTRGFFLKDGGYYFAISDYLDLALTGEIYTKGSWGLSTSSTYRKRYAFSGNFNMSFINTIMGEKGMPDYSNSKDFRVNWSHQQDAKANPNLTFSASVNFSTSSYNRNQLNSYYNPADFTQNTKSSVVNLSYKFPTIPLSISTSFNINQRSQDSTLSVSFPDLNINLSRIYPLKRKNPVGAERWYEKISLSYTGQLRNSVTTKENKFFESNLLKDWRNGMQHQIPISATFNLFKYVNITPSFSYTERWYTNAVERSWDEEKRKEKADTLWGFNRVYNFDFNVSASTKLYGFFKPMTWAGGKYVQMIRHVFTPSVSFSAAPDFGDPRWGFWKSYMYTNDVGQEIIRNYSPYEGGIFSPPSRGKRGVFSFNMTNNLEAKVVSKKDSTGFKKISLIDNFSLGMSYNFAADSMNWSNLAPSIRLKLTKDFSLNLNATFDTYTYQLNASGNPVRVNVPRWEKYGFPFFGRLMNTGTSFSYTLNNETFKKKPKSDNGEADEKASNSESTDPANQTDPTGKEAAPKSELQDGEVDEDGFMKYKIPWSLSFSYSMGLGYGEFNKERLEYGYKLTHNLSINGSITIAKNWGFNFSSSYDFDTKRISYMNCNITRDLHCWSISANFVPVGPYKSYLFTIRAKSTLLQDLKHEKRNSPADAMNWY